LTVQSWDATACDKYAILKASEEADEVKQDEEMVEQASQA